MNQNNPPSFRRCRDKVLYCWSRLSMSKIKPIEFADKSWGSGVKSAVGSALCAVLRPARMG